jgi:hypothetical protein
MRLDTGFFVCWLGLVCAVPSRAEDAERVDDICRLASGWGGEIVARVDQSYAGWDVEIGDADSDGKNEILTTGCPDSRLYLFKNNKGAWQTHLLADNLAEGRPGMGLAVKVVDLDRDGKNEIILGTGEEHPATAFFYVFQTDGSKLTKRLSSRPAFNKSGYTHNLASHDVDGDGLLEVFSAYCGNGEIIRYDVDKGLTRIDARKVHQLSGSGEESLIGDVDNDGRVEYITSNGFRAGRAMVEIFDFDRNGELVIPPRLTVDGFDENKCFYASIMVGDLDNDGKNEMVVGWKKEQKINKATIIAYRVGKTAEPVYTLAREDEAFDLAYFEKMMAIADVDNDGKNELVISTRGDNLTERTSSGHLGHVFAYKVAGADQIRRELLVKFRPGRPESSWLAVGDADNDGKNEIVLTTGKGDRTQPGISYVILLKKK